MATDFSPGLIQKVLQGELRAIFEQSIRDQLQAVADEAVNKAAQEMTNSLETILTTSHEFHSRTDRYEVVLQDRRNTT